MGLFSHFKKKRRSIIHHENEKLPYDERVEVKPLYLVTTIVPRNQARYFEDAYKDAGASLSFTMFAHSLPPEEIRNVLGEDETKKEMVFTVCQKETLTKIKKIAADRFQVSKISKGILLVSPINSVSGISVYRYLADMSPEEEYQNGK